MSTVCPYLWNHQFFSIRDTGAPCCRSYKEDDRRWDHVKLEEGLNSDLHKEARQKMRRGEWPAICGVCKRQEDEGTKSGRQIAIELYPDIDYDSEPKHIVFADLKFNNICNLKCRMCDHVASSSIYEEFKNRPVSEHPKFFKLKPTTVYDDEFKFNHIKRLIEDGLETFKITGGEPFAQKYFIKLVDWCIENGYNENLNIHITTNGTKFNKKLLNKLATFKKIRTIISMDGVGPVYEYIRYPSTWNLLTASLNEFKEYVIKYPAVFEVPAISAVLQTYNIFNIAQICNFCHDMGFYCNIDMNLKPSYSELNSEHLPLWLKNLAKHEFLENIYPVLKNDKNAKNFLRRLDQDKEQSKYFSILKETTENLDRHRGQSFEESLHAEMVKFLISEGDTNATSR